MVWKTLLSLTVTNLIINLVVASPGSTFVHDNEEVRKLFHLADKDGDHILTTVELHSIFLDFDIDDDGQITSNEFITDWLTRNLGTALEASSLFHSLDVDRSGYISEDPDIPFIVKFFDRDHNGSIDQTEFVVQWVKMMSAHHK